VQKLFRIVSYLKREWHNRSSAASTDRWTLRPVGQKSCLARLEVCQFAQLRLPAARFRPTLTGGLPPAPCSPGHELTVDAVGVRVCNCRRFVFCRQW
jgi:hypothetical protein